jgi:hypothetical protein
MFKVNCAEMEEILGCQGGEDVGVLGCNAVLIGK